MFVCVFLIICMSVRVRVSLWMILVTVTTVSLLMILATVDDPVHPDNPGHNSMLMIQATEHTSLVGLTPLLMIPATLLTSPALYFMFLTLSFNPHIPRDGHTHIQCIHIGLARTLYIHGVHTAFLAGK